MKRLFYAVIFIALIGFLYGTSLAEDHATAGNQLHGVQRFGRGVVNFFSSPLELPAQMCARASYWDERSKNQFAVIGGFIEGIPMGFVYFGWRFAAGVYDITTCPFWCYDKCIIEPEYITFSPEFLEKNN